MQFQCQGEGRFVGSSTYLAVADSRLSRLPPGIGSTLLAAASDESEHLRVNDLLHQRTEPLLLK